MNCNHNEARQLWINALRSGSYQQTKHVLCSLAGAKRSHCCLGVACEVFRQHEDPSLLPEEELSAAQLVRFGDNLHLLPAIVEQWLGLEGWKGDYNGSSLSTENDLGTTFVEIADIIESNPPGLWSQA